MALLSESDQVDVGEVANDLNSRHPGAEISTKWLEYGDIVWRLSGTLMNVFDYDYAYVSNPLYGISAAIRMAMAAGRPIVVSNCQQFKDLKFYDDEVYFIYNGLESTIRRVLEDISRGRERKPKQLLLNMNWTTCAGKYLEVYKSLVKEGVRV